MSEPSKNARPRQVTMVGWLTMVGSVFVLLLVFDRMAGMHTLETRESVESFVSEPAARDLGLSVDTVLSMMRTLTMVAGACAAAAGILGYHVLKRSRSARLALSIVAVPLFLAGMVTGGFVSSVVAASATLLWLQPSRDWFNGIAPRAETPSGSAVPAASAPSAPSASGRVDSAGSTSGPWPGPAGLTSLVASPATSTATTSAAPDRRPTAVTWAGVLTWVSSAITALGALASGVVLALEPDALIEQVRRDSPELDTAGVSDAMLIGVTVAMIAGLVLWCVAAAVLAVLVFRRIDWARIVLMVSAATAGAAFLAGTVAGAFVLVPALAACVATLLLLRHPDARAWFARSTPEG
ncbi:MAG: hypothetical protein WBP61_09590 [Nocardioides sp.]